MDLSGFYVEYVSSKFYIDTWLNVSKCGLPLSFLISFVGCDSQSELVVNNVMLPLKVSF